MKESGKAKIYTEIKKTNRNNIILQYHNENAVMGRIHKLLSKIEMRQDFLVNIVIMGMKYIILLSV